MEPNWGAICAIQAIRTRQALRIMSALAVYGDPVAELSRLAVAYRGLARESTKDLPGRKHAKRQEIHTRARELHAAACHAAGLEPGEVISKLLWTANEGGIDDYERELEECGIRLRLISKEDEENSITELPEFSELVKCLLEIAWLQADDHVHPHAFLAALADIAGRHPARPQPMETEPQ